MQGARKALGTAGAGDAAAAPSAGAAIRPANAQSPGPAAGEDPAGEAPGQEELQELAPGQGSDGGGGGPDGSDGTPAKVPAAGAALVGAAAAAQSAVPAFFGAHRVFMAPPTHGAAPGAAPPRRCRAASAEPRAACGQHLLCGCPPGFMGLCGGMPRSMPSCHSPALALLYGIACASPCSPSAMMICPWPLFQTCMQGRDPWLCAARPKRSGS
jgi:hypothetical protein